MFLIPNVKIEQNILDVPQVSFIKTFTPFQYFERFDLSKLNNNSIDQYCVLKLQKKRL